MEKRPIFVLLGLLAAAGALAEAYTWTDSDGIVHYSDRPEPGAKIIDLGTNRHSRPSPATRPSAASSQNNTDSAEPEPASGYTSIEIASPAAEETLWNIEGTLNVSIALTPPLRAGHQVRLYFDGAPQTVSGANIQLQEVWRGVHNLQAEVVDETGKLVIRGRPSRFYVQQNTILQ
jgi:hypothetical protein